MRSQSVEAITPAVTDRAHASATQGLDRVFANVVAALASPWREVLVLSDVQGLSRRAVAVAVGIDVTSVQVALQSARRLVSRRLVEESASALA